MFAFLLRREKGRAGGVATLDSGGSVPLSQIPGSIVGGLTFKGNWNATTNTPALASGVGTQGWMYRVSVAGATNLDGITDWQAGDYAAFNGTAWVKFDHTDQVASVFGRQGAIVAESGDYTPEQVGAPPTSRTVTAGAGLTGGGNLSANRTFNVAANADGSIAVNADDIQVGVLASDTQHGVRGGGTQHAAFVGDSGAGGVAGFVLAPVAGDAAAKKILTAAGAWAAFKTTQLFNNVAGALPLTTASFTTAGGKLLLIVSGSGYRTFFQGDGIVGCDIAIDGVSKGSAKVFTNDANSHKSFITNALVVTGIAAGAHTITLTELVASMVTNAFDFFNVTVIEVPA